MSYLPKYTPIKFSNYPGVGEELSNKTHYSQAVRVVDRIECSGQGGWDPATNEISKDFSEEVARAFKNVDHTLKHAGGRGWSQVYRVNIYLVETHMHEEAYKPVVANLKKWTPAHKPILTVVGVAKLYIPEMHIEVEVAAYDPPRD